MNRRDTPPAVYLVVEEIGLYGAYLERARADEIAQAIDGVVCVAPLVTDCRVRCAHVYPSDAEHPDTMRNRVCVLARGHVGDHEPSDYPGPLDGTGTYDDGRLVSRFRDPRRTTEA